MRLSLLFEAPGLTCPQCSGICQETEDTSITCPKCRFVFRRKTNQNTFETELIKPELKVSGRWGGPLADKFSATKSMNPSKITGA
jgi:hypothetical protein